MRFYMTCCTMVLLNEIEELKLSQKDVALTYAAAMRSEKAGVDNPDWGVIGAAGQKRWGPAGWKRVKDRAWGIYEGRVKP